MLILFCCILFQLNQYFAEKIFYDNFSITRNNEEDEIIYLNSFDYSMVIDAPNKEELDLFRYYQEIVPLDEQKYFAYLETYAFVSGIDALASPISAITYEQIGDFKLDGSYLDNEIPDSIQLLVDKRMSSIYKLGEKYQIIMKDTEGKIVEVFFFVSGYIDNEQLQPTTSEDKLQGRGNMYFTAVFENEKQVDKFIKDYSHVDEDILTKYQIHLPQKYKMLLSERGRETKIYVRSISQDIEMNNSMIKEKEKRHQTQLAWYVITVILSLAIFFLSELDAFKKLFFVKFVGGASKKRISYELMQPAMVLAGIAGVVMFGYFKLRGIYFDTSVPTLDRDYFSTKIYLQALSCLVLLFLGLYLFVYINVKIKMNKWKGGE